MGSPSLSLITKTAVNESRKEATGKTRTGKTRTGKTGTGKTRTGKTGNVNERHAFSRKKTRKRGFLQAPVTGSTGQHGASQNITPCANHH